MKDTDLYSRILGLIDPWLVADVELDTAGAATVPHLHFAVKRQGKFVDPGKYLAAIRRQTEVATAAGEEGRK